MKKLAYSTLAKRVRLLEHHLAHSEKVRECWAELLHVYREMLRQEIKHQQEEAERAWGIVAQYKEKETLRAMELIRRNP
jgi:hypothetical protein